MRRTMLRSLAVLVAVAAIAAGFFAHAADGALKTPELRPGLWEFTLSGQGDTKRRLCLTPEMVKDLKTLSSTAEGANDCKMSNERVAGKTRTFDVACTRPRKYRAKVSVTVYGPDHFVTTEDYVVETASGKSGKGAGEQRGRLAMTYRRIGECR